MSSWNFQGVSGGQYRNVSWKLLLLENSKWGIFLSIDFLGIFLTSLMYPEQFSLRFQIFGSKHNSPTLHCAYIHNYIILHIYSIFTTHFETYTTMNEYLPQQFAFCDFWAMFFVPFRKFYNNFQAICKVSKLDCQLLYIQAWVKTHTNKNKCIKRHTRIKKYHQNSYTWYV